MTCCKCKSKGGRCLNCACALTASHHGMIIALNLTTIELLLNYCCRIPLKLWNHRIHHLLFPHVHIHARVEWRIPLNHLLDVMVLGMNYSTTTVLVLPRRKIKMTGSVCSALFCSHKTQKPSGTFLNGRASKWL